MVVSFWFSTYTNNDLNERLLAAEAVRRAQIATQVLFSTDLANISADEIVLGLGDDPRLKFVAAEDILDKPISKLAGSFKLVSSNSTYANTYRILQIHSCIWSVTRRSESVSSLWRIVSEQPNC